MAQALELPAESSAVAALTAAAQRRPVCFSPETDSSLVPAGPLVITRLVRIAGPMAPETADPMSVVDLLQADDTYPGAITGEVLLLYQQAARTNPLLCVSLLAPLGARERNGCGR